jgi:hypothetical protein
MINMLNIKFTTGQTGIAKKAKGLSRRQMEIELCHLGTFRCGGHRGGGKRAVARAALIIRGDGKSVTETLTATAWNQFLESL